MPDGVAPDLYLNVQAGVAGWRHVFVDAPLVVRRCHREQLSRSGYSSYREAVATYRALEVGDGALDRVRRAMLARLLHILAVHRLAAGERQSAREAIREARAADPGIRPVRRRLVGTAASIPLAGRLAAKAVLRIAQLRT